MTIKEKEELVEIIVSTMDKKKKHKSSLRTIIEGIVVGVGILFVLFLFTGGVDYRIDKRINKPLNEINVKIDSVNTNIVNLENNMNTNFNSIFYVMTGDTTLNKEIMKLKKNHFIVENKE